MEKQEAEKVTKLEFEARKIYLEGYISTVRRLEEIEMELEELEYDIGPGSCSGNGMPGSGRVSDGSGRIINRMDRMMKLRSAIKREEALLIRRRDEMARAINTISKGKQQEVLHYRYIRDMELGDIADRMHYSYRQVQNIHNRAIKRIKLAPRALAHIKADLIEEHPEWAQQQAPAA